MIKNNNWLLITLLATTLIILGVIMPTIFWLSKNFNFTKKLHTTITNYYITEQTYAKILTDYKNYSTSQESLNKMLATEQTLSELDKELNLLAKKNQLDLQYNWGETKTATLSYKNLKISTSGNASNILNFVNALENLPTYISIQNLEMQTDYPLTSGFILAEVYLKI
ncbi:MAG: type 4a pilus biogenesis protein PilO [Patescibacteria group bacterium]